jgi:hypothetical protein
VLVLVVSVSLLLETVADVGLPVEVVRVLLVAVVPVNETEDVRVLEVVNVSVLMVRVLKVAVEEV